jgi:hypothetical protein
VGTKRLSFFFENEKLTMKRMDLRWSENLRGASTMQNG